MRYVIIRDDDTNALTPSEFLDRLYQPFLQRGMPVNLATIPNVNTEALHCDGGRELFLVAKKGPTPKYLPIGCNEQLVHYLKTAGYKIIQHGCRHEFLNNRSEFDQDDGNEMARRLDEGRKFLMDAGFPCPKTFVAPYDKLTRISLREVSKRFSILSTGWYELKRLPLSWLPGYITKKLNHQTHWRVGNTLLLTHPGCHLSYHRPYDTMVKTIRESINSRRVTVLVTHWWEYFRDGTPDEAFIDCLHETAAYLGSQRDIKVISFSDLVTQNIPLN